MIDLSLTEEYITIDNTDEVTLVKPKLLSEDKAYNHFLDRVCYFYNRYLDKNDKQDFREYQLKYAAMMCCRRYNFMGWEQRTGKTLTCVLIIQALYSIKYTEHQLYNFKGVVKATSYRPVYQFDVRAKSIHIAVPSILAAMSWVKELSQSDLKDQFALVTSYKELLEAEVPIIIYSHDFPKNKENKKERRISKALSKLRPNLLIVDEAHGLKGNSLRSQHMQIVRNNSRRVISLSGTPSEGSLSDIWYLMAFTYNKHWPYRRPEDFIKTFGTKQKLQANYLLSSHETIPDKFLQQLELNKMPAYYKLMQRFLHRLTLSDPEVSSCVKVPTTNAILYRLEPDIEQKRLYDNYIEERKSQLIKAAHAVTLKQKAEALQLINPLIELTNQWEEDNNKLKKCAEIINSSVGKVIIFCARISSARVITNYLKKEFKQDSIVRIYATDPEEDKKTLTQEDRIELVTKFQYESKVKVGVFSINLASEAIELNSASDIIFYCMPWSSIKIRQAISRPVGPGNPYDTVNIHYPFFDKFIDEYQVTLAISKIKSINLLDYNVNSLEGEIDLSPTEVIRKLLS